MPRQIKQTRSKTGRTGRKSKRGMGNEPIYHDVGRKGMGDMENDPYYMEGTEEK